MIHTSKLVLLFLSGGLILGLSSCLSNPSLTEKPINPPFERSVAEAEEAYPTPNYWLSGTNYFTRKKTFLKIEGGKITASSMTRPVGAEIFEVDAWIFPAPMDLHNHLEQAPLKRWQLAEGFYNNRFEWRTREKDFYQAHMKTVSDHYNNTPLNICASVRWGELKALFGGVVLTQGLGLNNHCSIGFGILNAELLNPESAENISITTQRIRASLDLVSPSKHGGLVKAFPDLLRLNPKLNPDESFKKIQAAPPQHKEAIDGVTRTIKNLREGSIQISHLAEGRRDDEYNQSEFNLAWNLGLLRKNLVVIHGTGFTPEQMKLAASQDVTLVWSPLSNLMNYGQTTDIEEALEAGLNVAIAPDWSFTGSKNILDEIKVARDYLTARHREIKEINKLLFEMSVANPREALGISGESEHLAESGDQAHLLLLDKKTSDPYADFVGATQNDIEAVIVNGEPLFGSYELIKNWNDDFSPEVTLEKMVTSLDNKTPKCRKEFGFRNSPFGSFSRNADLKTAISEAIRVGLETQKLKPEEQKKLTEDLMKNNTLRDLRTILQKRRQEVPKPALVDGGPNFDPDPLFSCEDPFYQGYIRNFVKAELPRIEKTRGEQRTLRKLNEKWSPFSF